MLMRDVLPQPLGPDEGEKLALVHRQVDVVERQRLARFALQPVPFRQLLDLKLDRH